MPPRASTPIRSRSLKMTLCFGLLLELGRVGVLETRDVAGVLDDGGLEPEADAEERDLLLPRVPDRLHHALDAAAAEAAGHEDRVGAEEHVGVLVALEGLGVDVVELDPDVVGDPAVRERLVQGLVGVAVVHVLPDDRDVDLAGGVLDPVDEALPLGEVAVVVGQGEQVEEDLVQPLRREVQGDLVDRRHVLGVDDGLDRHVAEERDLALDLVEAATRSVRQRRTSGWIPIESRSLTECCVGLVFSSSEALMYGTRVRCTLIALPRPASWRNCRIASRKGSDSMSPTVPPISTRTTSASVPTRADRLLDLVGDVGDDLHGLAQVVAAALPLDHRRVDPAGRRVVDLRGRSSR